MADFVGILLEKSNKDRDDAFLNCGICRLYCVLFPVEYYSVDAGMVEQRDGRRECVSAGMDRIPDLYGGRKSSDTEAKGTSWLLSGIFLLGL